MILSQCVSVYSCSTWSPPRLWRCCLFPLWEADDREGGMFTIQRSCASCHMPLVCRAGCGWRRATPIWSCSSGSFQACREGGNMGSGELGTRADSSYWTTFPSRSTLKSRWKRSEMVVWSAWPCRMWNLWQSLVRMVGESNILRFISFSRLKCGVFKFVFFLARHVLLDLRFTHNAYCAPALQWCFATCL